MDEVLAQGLLFFLAGYDTTATSIAFLLYNLALNPEIQEKLYEEIVDAAGDKVFRVNSRYHILLNKSILPSKSAS